MARALLQLFESHHHPSAMHSSILLVTSSRQHAELFRRCLQTSAYRIAAAAAPGSDLLACARACAAELVLVDSDEPLALLDAMRELCASLSVPVVLFTQDDNPETLRKTLQAGVTSYILDGFEPRRIAAILDVAVARFHETERLKTELQKTRDALAERKAVDRAKGILMKQKGLDEPDAYRVLRKLAMDKNLRIGEAAERLIAVAEILNA